MINLRLLAFAAAAASALGASGPAGATAQTGGVISTTFSDGGGSCNQTAQVSLTTPQDSFALTLAASCAGGSAGGSLRSSTATGSIGLKVSAAGTGFVSSTVSLVDHWILTPPPGTPAGTVAIPFGLQVDGTASGTAVLGTFISYVLVLQDFYSSLPGSRLEGIGSITAPGTYLHTFPGPLNVRTFGSGGGLQTTTVQISLAMSVSQLAAGTIDFYNSAAVTLALPPGWTAATSSGLAVTPVPEPPPALLLLVGAGALALRRRRSSSPA